MVIVMDIKVGLDQEITRAVEPNPNRNQAPHLHLLMQEVVVTQVRTTRYEGEACGPPNLWGAAMCPIVFWAAFDI